VTKNTESEKQTYHSQIADFFISSFLIAPEAEWKGYDAKLQ
jgi:hypothetical protein